MKLYCKEKDYVLLQGDVADMLDAIKSDSIDSIVTDPPYELNFMNKNWDNMGVSFKKETWQKCYEVLKPGGYLLAFGGSRTFHRIACAIEDAGFEIRDTIMWIYGSGFPKSMNIGLAIDKKNGVESEVIGKGKSGVSSRAYQSEETTTAGDYEIKKATNKWNGWGSALKPSYESIVVARKPFKGSLIDNVLKFGVGGINIDECRVGNEVVSIHNAPKGTFAGGDYNRGSDTESYRDSVGRFPANTILTYDETDFDEVCGGFPITNPTKRHSGDGKPLDTRNMGWGFKRMPCNIEDNGGSASRYFYCAKASKKDRDEGLDGFITVKKNTHPTVKPTELMQYLVRLVTPNGGIVLDPFSGSGSTGKAAMYENLERDKGYKYIGIELVEEYLPISKARIDFVCSKKEVADESGISSKSSESDE